jgi:hypothetical protein
LCWVFCFDNIESARHSLVSCIKIQKLWDLNDWIGKRRDGAPS